MAWPRNAQQSGSRSPSCPSNDSQSQSQSQPYSQSARWSWEGAPHHTDLTARLNSGQPLIENIRCLLLCPDPRANKPSQHNRIVNFNRLVPPPSYDSSPYHGLVINNPVGVVGFIRQTTSAVRRRVCNVPFVPPISEIEMHPAHLPCGNPHSLRRTIRHIVFYFQVFLSNCSLAFWGNLCICASRVSFSLGGAVKMSWNAPFGLISYKIIRIWICGGDEIVPSFLILQSIKTVTKV